MTSSETARTAQSDEPDPRAAGRFVPGQVVAGRFAVIRYIARGGMGEVYEVEDRFLQNVHVALKVILPEIAGDTSSSHHFEQEVLLARKVVHPNLCPIYDIARCDDPPPAFLCLTMKLLAGETLSARLKRPPLIPREEAITIFRQLIAGLAAIHTAGIIHRDIKPNNVMLDTSGPELCVSIMDFGLARLHEAETTIASQSLMAGTPGYMAPEILRGQGPSQAADLFALGVLLHQLLTREHPKFKPRSLTAEPSPKLDNADVPPVFVHAVKEFLSSEPERRSAAFEQLKAALLIGSSGEHWAADAPLGKVRSKWIRPAAWLFIAVLLLSSLLLIPAIGERFRGMVFSSAEKHIAVLPLETVGGNPQTQAVGDGLMDSLAGRLSNLDVVNHTLWVVPASDVRARKVTDSSSALREFGATIVLRGRFQRADDSAHLQLFLIDARNSRQIGYVELTTQNGDLASLEDEAITRVGRLLNLKLEGEQARTTEQPSNRAAFEDYLAGVGYLEREDQEGNLEKAVTALQSAIKTDPHFSLACARLAQVYLMKYRLTSDPQWLQQAETYSRRAAELDANVPSTYVALAQIHELTGKHDLAVQEYQRALSLDPQDASAFHGLASSFQNEGRNSEAEAAYIKAASIRPEDWTGYNLLGIFYQNTGQTQKAIAAFQHALQLTPENSWVNINLALAYQDAGGDAMLRKAEDALKTSIATSKSFVAYADLADLYLQEHRFSDAVTASLNAVGLNKRSAESWENLTFAYEWQKDDREAAAARAQAVLLFEAQIGQNPRDALAHANLAALYAKDGLKDKAAESIRISLALSPRNRYVLSEVADAYELLGNRQQAIACLTEALAQGFSRDELRADPEIQGVLSDPRFAGPNKTPPL